MTTDQRDHGLLRRTAIDYDHRVHCEDGSASLLVVRGVPADECPVCDEYWFDEDTGFALAELLAQHRPAPGTVTTLRWHEAVSAA